MQMEILFINPSDAGQYWKTVSSKSSYREKKTRVPDKQRERFPLWETTWFFPTPPQSNQSLLGLCF